jgi:hypothetical protein
MSWLIVFLYTLLFPSSWSLVVFPMILQVLAVSHFRSEMEGKLLEDLMQTCAFARFERFKG